MTYQDVGRLLEDVGDIVHTWMLLLDNISMSLDPPRVGGTRAAATALRLFDWREWNRAQWRAERELGPRAPP